MKPNLDKVVKTRLGRLLFGQSAEEALEQEHAIAHQHRKKVWAAYSN